MKGMQSGLPRMLRVLRAERGLTLEEAAKKTGVTRETLGLLERGRRHPVTPTLAKIAKGYGVPVTEILPLGEVEGGEPAFSPKAQAPPEVGGTPARSLSCVNAWATFIEGVADD